MHVIPSVLWIWCADTPFLLEAISRKANKFTVRVGSIFERSHIALHKWLLGAGQRARAGWSGRGALGGAVVKADAGRPGGKEPRAKPSLLAMLLAN